MQQDDVHGRLSAMDMHMAALGASVAKLSETQQDMLVMLQALVRIEERQAQVQERLQGGAQKMIDHDVRLRDLERSLPRKLDERLDEMEKAMPGLLEMRKWVVIGVLAGVGMIGAALVTMVLRVPGTH